MSPTPDGHAGESRRPQRPGCAPFRPRPRATARTPARCHRGQTREDRSAKVQTELSPSAASWLTFSAAVWAVGRFPVEVPAYVTETAAGRQAMPAILVTNLP